MHYDDQSLRRTLFALLTVGAASVAFPAMASAQSCDTLAKACSVKAPCSADQMFQIADCYRKAGKHQQLVKWATPFVEAGNADALYVVGETIKSIKDVPDRCRVAAWYTSQAAKQNHADAQYSLSLMYERGECNQKDADMASRWLVVAADNGNAAAQNEVGYRYLNATNGMPRDVAKAFMWFSRSAQQDYPAALLNLGLMYEQGNGTDVNLHKAYNLYARAQQLGVKKATERVNRVSQALNNTRGQKYDRLSYLDNYSVPNGYPVPRVAVADMVWVPVSGASSSVAGPSCALGKCCQSADACYCIGADCEMDRGVMKCHGADCCKADDYQCLCLNKRDEFCACDKNSPDYNKCMCNLGRKEYCAVAGAATKTGGCSGMACCSEAFCGCLGEDCSCDANQNCTCLGGRCCMMTDNACLCNKFGIECDKGGTPANNVASSNLMSNFGSIKTNPCTSVEPVSSVKNKNIAAEIGQMYFFSYCGMNRDVNIAAQYIQKSAELGNAKMMRMLADGYASSTFGKQDKAQYIKWLTKAAEAGDAGSMYKLAMDYEVGLSGTLNGKFAAYWYDQAARAGHADAQFKLARMYLNGEQLAQDRNSALYWMQRAANQRNSQAVSMLKSEFGYDVEQIEEIDAKNGQAYYELGQKYGAVGLNRNLDKAIAYYEKGVALNHTGCMNALGMLYRYEKSDLQNARKYFEKAATAGDAEAQTELASIYEDKSMLDIQKAFKWYTSAAEQGVSRAQFSLAKMYIEGKGTKVDQVMAINWLVRAARQGDSQANDMLKQLSN